MPIHTASLGISFNTFKAAKKEIGVKAKKREDGWWWELPQGDSQDEEL